jgi:hypothetical protein
MKFLTVKEAKVWCRGAGIAAKEFAEPWPSLRCATPAEPGRTAWFARWIVGTIPAVGSRLMWPKDWGIWPSSENWTLVQRLRAGYGESRPFEDAPVVLAEPTEIEDLAAFLEVGLLSGWDIQVFGTHDVLRVWISHDEWAELRRESASLLDQIRAELTGASIELLDGTA